MKMLLVAVALLGAMSLPALAKASDDMSCSHFNGMKSSGRMAAVESMQSGMAAGNKMAAHGAMATGAMKSNDHMSTSQMTKKIAAVCKSHPDMMMGEAMHSASGH